MTNDESIKILNQFREREGNSNDDVKALDMAIQALEQCEVWNGSHGQIVAPKGTFERIYNDCKDEQLNYLKKRDGNYVHYNVEWLLKNWQMELDILSDGKIKPCEDCISRQAVLDIINFEDEWLFDAKSHNADTKIAFSTIKSKISELPSVTPTSDAEDKYDIGYNCGYADAMSDIAES